MQRDIAVIDIGVDEIIRLLPFISSIDLFIKVYGAQLTLRLLDKKHVSLESEAFLVSKLKSVFGIREVKYLECILKDVESSNQQAAEFKKNNNSATIDGVEFTPEILTKAYWPTEAKLLCRIPIELSTCQSVFNAFYKSRFSKRSLTWYFNKGQTEILTTFTSRRHRLIANVIQTSIICLFNDRDEIEYQGIKNELEISDDALKSALHCLCHPKI